MDRTILITGGTGALGGAATKRFLDDGYRVPTTWVVKEEAEAFAEQFDKDVNERLTLIETDVTDPDSIASSLEGIEAGFGPVDVLVHLVGAWKDGEEVHDHSLKTWDRMMDLNLRSAFLCCRAVLLRMRERGWGRVVLVSSRTAREDRSGQAAYAIAKAGVRCLRKRSPRSHGECR